MAATAPQTITFAVRGPITRSDLSGLCERVCALLEQSGADVVLRLAASGAKSLGQPRTEDCVNVDSLDLRATF